MTKDEQRQFAQDLIASITKDVLAGVEKAPEFWTGRQIRRYVGEEFYRRTPCGSPFTRTETRKFNQDRLGWDL